jgi:hypothetical protein
MEASGSASERSACSLVSQFRVVSPRMRSPFTERISALCSGAVDSRRRLPQRVCVPRAARRLMVRGAQPRPSSAARCRWTKVSENNSPDAAV